MVAGLSSFEILYGGARGGGKSDVVIHLPLRWIHKPAFKALILRATFPQLQELEDRCRRTYTKLGGRWVASESRFIFPSGASIQLGYGETWADIVKYQGFQYQFIAYDEVGNLREERCWVMLFGCCRSPEDPTITCQIIGTANPGGVGHGWLRRRFIEQCPPDGTPVWTNVGTADEPEWITRSFVQAKVYDNPTIVQNDPSYISRLRALPELLRKQHLEGDWAAGEGIAFPKLTRTSHQKRIAVEPWHRWFMAFDWGYGHQWATILFRNVGKTQVHVQDMAMGRRQVPLEIAERVSEMLKSQNLTFHQLDYTVSGRDKATGDGAKGGWGPTIEEQMLMAGWVLSPGDPARISGYQNALTYLESGNLTFEPGKMTDKLIECLMNLSLDPDQPNDILKVDYDPVNDIMGDDPYDALKMGLMSRPLQILRPVESLPAQHNKGFDRYLTKPVEKRGFNIPRIESSHALG